MHKKILGSACWLCTMLLFLMMSVSTTVAFEDVENLEESSSKWANYTDPRFDFSIEYDPNWEVVPRNDNNGMLSTLTFISGDDIEAEEHTDPHRGSIKVEIGMYLVSWNERNNLPTRSLKEWTEQYNQISEVPTFAYDQCD